MRAYKSNYENISDLDFRRVSSFIDGELDQNEVKFLLQDMSRNSELKDLYFKMIELSETSKELKPIGFRTQIANLSLGNLLVYLQKDSSSYYYLFRRRFAQLFYSQHNTQYKY